MMALVLVKVMIVVVVIAVKMVVVMVVMVMVVVVIVAMVKMVVVVVLGVAGKRVENRYRIVRRAYFFHILLLIIRFLHLSFNYFPFFYDLPTAICLYILLYLSICLLIFLYVCLITFTLPYNQRFHFFLSLVHAPSTILL